MRLEARVKANKPGFILKRTALGMEIHVRSPPENNRANAEIVKELTRLTGRRVSIIRGLKSKNKTLVIGGLTQSGLEKLL